MQRLLGELALWLLTEGGPALIEAFVQLQTEVNAFFADTGLWLLDAGREMIEGLVNGIKEKIPSLTDVLGGITDMIPNIKGPIEEDRKLLQPSGVAIMEGLIAGIKEMTVTTESGGYEPTYWDLLEDLLKAVDEEIEMLRRVVDDEDSACPFRSLRAERMRAFQTMRDLLETYRTWEW